MHRYFIKLSYSGTSYFGWQIQVKQISVQEVITKAFSTLLNEKTEITGCGRTDTGVHARNYIAHFDYSLFLDENQLKQFVFKLNSFLPKDIVIHSIHPVDSNAHARFDAKSRTYKYYISREKNPFFHDFSWYLYGNIDLEAMNKAAEILKEYKDFSCFSKSHTQTKTNNCEIYEAFWTYEDTKNLVFTITADRFLRNMVRAIVGTLIEIGLGKMKCEEIRSVIESKNRNNAGSSVPARGLILERIIYPENIYLK